MSVYRDKKEWNKWNEMVLASEHAKEDFNDFADDRAIIRADKKIQSLLSKNYSLERQLAEARESYIIIWLNELSLDMIVVMYGNNVKLNDVYYGLLEDQGFIDSIEQFLIDEELSLDGNGLELKISSLIKQEGQMSFPETGQYDFSPYWECDIELHKD